MHGLILLLFLGIGQMSVEPVDFDVDIVLRDMTALSAFEFRVAFDPDILVVDAVVSDWPYLWHAGDVSGGVVGFIAGAVNTTSRSIDVVELVVATIHFRAKGIGVTQIALTDILICNVMGDEITPIVVDGSIQVRAVDFFAKPVPK